MRTPPPCAREQEVLDLATIGVWPARADEDLRAHADTCPTCRDLAAVVTALIDFAGASPLASEARLPDARLVWHRAQMRARQDAARRAARPLVLAEIAAAAVVLLVLAAWGGHFGHALTESGRAVWAGFGSTSEWLSSAPRQFRESFTVWTTDGSSLLVRPLAVALGLGLTVVLAAFGLSRLADRSDNL